MPSKNYSLSAENARFLAKLQAESRKRGRTVGSSQALNAVITWARERALAYRMMDAQQELIEELLVKPGIFGLPEDKTKERKKKIEAVLLDDPDPAA